MAELKSISISDIHIGERLREIEEDHAQAIAASIKEVGLQSPITVRPTPAAKGGKFTLVAGAHRLRACEIAGLSEVDALVVKADGREAQLLEITENLFRNELSVIDRAVFVQKYRELWEDEHGAIKAGRPDDNRVTVTQLGTISFSAHVADRLGVSEASAKRLDRIARQLHPELKSTFRGTPVADQTTVLLKLAKLPPHLQRRAAIGWRETQDVKQVFTLLSDKPAAPTISASEALFSKLVDLWSRADNEAKSRFLDHIGVSVDAIDAAE
jgi:ParB family chromosome partitioning protein